MVAYTRQNVLLEKWISKVGPLRGCIHPTKCIVRKVDFERGCLLRGCIHPTKCIVRKVDFESRSFAWLHTPDKL